MTKRTNLKRFSAIVNGVEYRFDAWTTSTRNGMCETVESLDFPITNSRYSWMNRPWQRFGYCSALQTAIKKFPKDMQQALTDQLIEHKAAEETARAEKVTEAFEKAYNGLSDRGKEIMKSHPHLNTLEDAEHATGIMMMMNLLGI